MGKKLKELTKEEIKLVKASALAKKHNCSDVYVRCVLSGARGSKTMLAKMILADAWRVIAIYNKKTSEDINIKR